MGSRPPSWGKALERRFGPGREAVGGLRRLAALVGAALPVGAGARRQLRAPLRGAAVAAPAGRRRRLGRRGLGRRRRDVAGVAGQLPLGFLRGQPTDGVAAAAAEPRPEAIGPGHAPPAGPPPKPRPPAGPGKPFFFNGTPIFGDFFVEIGFSFRRRRVSDRPTR